MKVELSYRKPKISLNGKPFCDFRVGKAYLWGLVHERLCSLLTSFDHSPSCLDAACHSLISRKIFPTQYSYYGLDISKARLLSGLPLSLPSDTLFLADITKSFGLNSVFDVVVSLNTLSHLPTDLQLSALQHLIASTKPGGHFLFNTSLDRSTSSLLSYASSQFSSIEPIYYHSYASDLQEDAGAVNKSNVFTLMPTLEFAFPNDACFHREVLFHAKNSLNTGHSDLSEYEAIPTSQIIQLNSVPRVSVRTYADDSQYLSSLSVDLFGTCIILTSYLARSLEGLTLLEYFASMKQEVKILSPQMHLSSSVSRLHILGLESGWSDDESIDRVSLNILKSLDRFQFEFILVEYRADKECRPSTIAFDV